MSRETDTEQTESAIPVPADRNFSRGLIGSLILHAAIILLILYRMTAPQPPDAAVHAFPVDIVLSDETTSPPQPLKAQVPLQQSAPVRAQQRGVARSQQPRQTASLEPYKPNPPAATEPPTEQPRDELQAKLEAFAKLRLPDSGQQAQGSSGTSAYSATSNGAGLGPTAYSVNDFVRAQVERRWNLDLTIIDDPELTVSIHVVLTPRDGVIRKVEIVDNGRFKTDAVYHSIALSARNAAILSSPIALPAGRYADTLDLVLKMNPKDVVK
jgi:hypothetical protein